MVRRTVLLTSTVLWALSLVVVSNPSLLGGTTVFPSAPVDPLASFMLFLSTVAFASLLTYDGLKTIWFDDR